MEAENLRRLFESVRNKAYFAYRYGVPGGPSMVSQHLSGNRPISGEAAVAYARGFNVPVSKISPRFAALVNAAAAATGEEVRYSIDTEHSTGLEQLSIPVMANAGAMGGGADQLHDDVVVGQITVSPEWALRMLKPTGLQALRFIHGHGESMSPTFSDGDVLLVDTGITDAKVDGVYVLQANDRIYIKRVRQRMDGSFEISSDNPTVKTVDVLDGQAQVSILGRVLWAWNGRKL